MADLPPFELEKDDKNKIAQLWVTSIAGTALVIVIQSFGADWSRAVRDWRGLSFDKVPEGVKNADWVKFQPPLQQVRRWVAVGSSLSIALVVCLRPDRFKKGDEWELALVFACVIGCIVGLLFYARRAFHSARVRYPAQTKEPTTA